MEHSIIEAREDEVQHVLAREDEDSCAWSPLSKWKLEDSSRPSPQLASTKEEPSAQAQEGPKNACN
jgi:hypothetical protein